MFRVSTGLSVCALAAAIACVFLPAAEAPAIAGTGVHKPDFSSAGIDMMPVGTPKQVDRLKRARSGPKA